MSLQPAVHWLLHGETDSGGRDYEGTAVQSVAGVRNSWEIWKEKLPEGQMSHLVAEFVGKREDSLVQEERWRQKMMSRLGDKFDNVDARLEKMSERMEELAGACAAIQASVRGLETRQQQQQGK